MVCLQWNAKGNPRIIQGIVAVLVCTALTAILHDKLESCRTCFSRFEMTANVLKQTTSSKKKFCVFGAMGMSTMSNIFVVLNHLGYENDPSTPDWDLLWPRGEIYIVLEVELRHTKPHQVINQMPGTAVLTLKVHMMAKFQNSSFIAPSFTVPENENLLREYAKQNPNALFVEKGIHHRGVKIVNVSDIDFKREEYFIQKFVDNPLLISGHKFELGIYTIITSIDPLRVYIYNGDIALRFCPKEYHPFDPHDLDKYIVADRYRPIWNVSIMKDYYNEGFGMRSSLIMYLKSKGIDSSPIFKQIESIMSTVLQIKDDEYKKIQKLLKTKGNFFELVRFDFLVDENLKVYLLEANLSPNLSASSFPQNMILFQQVIYNTLSLVGVAVRIRKNTLAMSSEEEIILANEKNIAVYPTECVSETCLNGCQDQKCRLCSRCLSLEDKAILLKAYKEHVNKMDCKRVYPPPMNRSHTALPEDFDRLSDRNQLMYKWFLGKCLLNDDWCY